VCGAAAATRTTQLVEDVHAFPDHIACDSRSESEVVVPVLDQEGELIAVLDVDATTRAAFDEVDARGLEAIVARIFAG
jgi:GAF domain-containing protein